jgi:hypothetical protein
MAASREASDAERLAECRQGFTGAMMLRALLAGSRAAPFACSQ